MIAQGDGNNRKRAANQKRESFAYPSGSNIFSLAAGLEQKARFMYGNTQSDGFRLLQNL